MVAQTIPRAQEDQQTYHESQTRLDELEAIGLPWRPRPRLCPVPERSWYRRSPQQMPHGEIRLREEIDRQIVRYVDELREARRRHADGCHQRRIRQIRMVLEPLFELRRLERTP